MSEVRVHPSSVVSSSAHLGARTVVEPFALIGHNPGRPDPDHTSSSIWMGEDCVIRSGAVIYDGVQLGATVEIGHHAVLREYVCLGAYTRVWPHTSIRRAAQIGRGCRVGGIVGDHSVIADYVTSLGSLVHDYRSGIGGQQELAPLLATGCVVSRGAVVVGGVTVGAFAFVNAGSVVARPVPDYAIVAGNPARVVGERSAAEVDRVRDRIRTGESL
jgi:UDP-2-acetamido-3-amino-2,3-dideoxy-glucuronate N-acetyltransferase